jgi:allantoin racemase
MRTVHLINPNTSTATTAMMLARAREVAPASLSIEGLTAEFGPLMITEPEALAAAADAVVQLMPRLTGDGVIVAAFGDPGADRLASRLSVPVVGIGEAAIRTAGRGGRRFAIVTTTPGLASSIRAHAGKLGFADGLASLRITTENPAALVTDPPRLEAALRVLVRQCAEQDGAEAIIIGGGPLADAARALAAGSAVEIIEPVAAAVAAMAHALNAAALTLTGPKTE